ncbi:MAG TPA: hypothetical protein PLU07_07730, partial [Ferruginibacter sp.]|nr:hypothetical protein [Ferruginibacter sp.]
VRSVVEKNLTTKNTKVFTKDSKTYLVSFAHVHFVLSVVKKVYSTNHFTSLFQVYFWEKELNHNEH